MIWTDYEDKEKASVILILFSASPQLKNRCQRLWEGDLSQVLLDSFSLFVICLDELWLQAQDIVDTARQKFGDMELVSVLEQSFFLFWRSYAN